MVKLIWPKGRKLNADKYLQDGVAAYAYAVLIGSDPRTEQSVVMKFAAGLDLSEPDDMLPDSIHFLLGHLTDGTFSSVWQLLPRPAEYPCWAAEPLSSATYQGCLQITLPHTENSGDPADSQASDQAARSGPTSSGGANVGRADVGDDERMECDEAPASGKQPLTQTIVAHISAPSAQFMKDAVAGVDPNIYN